MKHPTATSISSVRRVNRNRGRLGGVMPTSALPKGMMAKFGPDSEQQPNQ